ncbi:tripartite motif-containing protein 45 [Acipenser oxyrinchus oxyrinchus]|uniref:RING-type E3 ubiquitin transferase n=1 Tax=Acipenser oxyrinchus oxyrinchus TaxID=40147 RepID=A0AAD8LKJ4_ACIOX|nr:tripartite motif-containing protein 45 [Acipenser oxyrinchus oxyrinchus]
MSLNLNKKLCASDPHSQASGSGVNTRAKCSACRHFYCDPKILPCLHTFCAECIQQLEQFSIQGKTAETLPEESYLRDQPSVTILCPVCDSEVDLPPAGVQGLTTDHLAVSEVFLESLLNEDCELVCDLCSEGTAEKRCDVCCVNLCEFCCQAHRRQKKTASHTTVRLQDLNGSSRIVKPIMCLLHPAEEVRLFCETCDQPVCRDCVVTGHRDHACDYAANVIHKHGDSVRELLKNVQPHVGVLERALSDIESVQQSVEVRADAVAEEVRVFAEGYVKAIEKHRDGLLNQLEELRVQKRNQLHLQRVQLEQILSDMKTGVDFTERLLTSGSDLEILMAKGVAVSRLKRLLEVGYNPHPAVDDGVHFLPQERAAQSGGFEVFGVIHTRAVEPAKCAISGEGFQVGRQGHPSEFTVICKDSAGEQMAKGGEIVRISIVHKEKKDCATKPTVQDNNDGTYRVSYTPQEAGTYTVWVCVTGQHIQGSPFVLVVRSKVRKHRGVFHCCTFCSSGGQKEARCGCGGTMPGGYQGCGHGHKGHPGKPHWSCCGNLTEVSECAGATTGTNSSRSLFRTVAL